MKQVIKKCMDVISHIVRFGDTVESHREKSEKSAQLLYSKILLIISQMCAALKLQSPVNVKFVPIG